MNKMLVIGLFGGLGTFIYYCIINKNINKKQVNYDKINDKEDKNEEEEIIKNDKLSDILIPDKIISNEINNIIDSYVDDIINNDIKNHYQIILYEKPKSLFELYINDYWEIM
jgi:hypothetical protein